MVYVAGVLGFICGFLAGQWLLLKLLKERSKQDLLNDKSLGWTYGVLNWVVAGIGSYLFVFVYTYYFS